MRPADAVSSLADQSRKPAAPRAEIHARPASAPVVISPLLPLPILRVQALIDCQLGNGSWTSRKPTTGRLVRLSGRFPHQFPPERPKSGRARDLATLPAFCAFAVVGFRQETAILATEGQQWPTVGSGSPAEGQASTEVPSTLHFVDASNLGGWQGKSASTLGLWNRPRTAPVRTCGNRRHPTSRLSPKLANSSRCSPRLARASTTTQASRP